MNNKKLKIFKFSQNIWVCELYLPWHTSGIPGVKNTSYRQERSVQFTEPVFGGVEFTDEEVKKINSFPTLKKQIEWSAGRVCIKKLAKLILGKKCTDIFISYKEKGAPYITNYPDTGISISHSGDYAMALINIGSGRAALDIETVKSRNFDAIRKVALSERENSQIPHSADELVKIFTVKEAYMKYIEMGFHESLKKIEIIHGDLYHDSRLMENISFLSYNVDESHIATILYEETEDLCSNEIGS